MGRRRKLAVGAVAVAVLLLAVFLARHTLVRVVLQAGLSAATGYSISYRDQAIGWRHAALTGVHVTKGGDPVLDAERIDIEYALRDIFPGGKHRYGFAAVSVQQPVITLVRHRDGSYNLTRGGTSASAPSSTKQAARPLFFTARIRNGTIRLVDLAPRMSDLAVQTIVGVSVDASVQTAARTVAVIDGTFVGRRARDAKLEEWPIHERTVVDYPHGYATHRVRATALPLRGILNYLIHSPSVRFDDGVLNAPNVVIYAVGIDPLVPITYRIGGGAELSGAQISVVPLIKPVRDLHGHLDLFDDGFSTRRLDGTLAGAPLRARGAIYDFAALRFRLGIAGDADLRDFRHAFAFMDALPVAGRTHVEALITATVEKPYVHATIDAPAVSFANVPIDNAHAAVDYADDVVSFGNVRAGYGALATVAAGTVKLGQRDATVQAYIGADGDAADLPYAQQLIAGQHLHADAIVSGVSSAGYDIRGALAARGAGATSDAFIAVDSRGRGEFGPFFLRRADGSSLIGALRLERPVSQSAGWLDAHRYRVDIPARAAILPGVVVPGFPAIGGTVDGAIVAGGSPDRFGIAGRVRASGATYATYPLGTVRADIVGTFAQLHLNDVAVDGPVGTFRGSAAVANETFALTGQYDGSLERLVPFTGDIGAHGPLHAPVTAIASSGGLIVQTSGASSRGARVRGIGVDDASGTIAVNGKNVRIIAAGASVGGAPVAITGAKGSDEVAVSAFGVPARTLRDAGLPLAAGRVSIFGVANLKRTGFNGTVDLTGGRAQGYPVSGWADVALAGSTLAVRDGEGALGMTYARIGGRVDGIGERAFHYALDADVPLADVATVVRDARLPVKYAEGSFNARLAVAGGGAAPTVTGTIGAPEGSYNELAFADGHARVAIAAPSVRLDQGRVRVGSTHARFAATLAPRAIGVSASSADANLADFDDYFDPSDMLAGVGRFAVSYHNDGRSTVTSGTIAMRDTRIRRYPLGVVDAAWSTRGGRIAETASLAGPAGSVQTFGSILPAAGDPLASLRHATYDTTVRARGIDLSTWLPAAGVSMPVLGRVDGDLTARGRFPQLALAGTASLADGHVGPYTIGSATFRAHALGNRVTLDGADADLGFAQVSGSGTLGLGAGDPLALRVHTTVADLAVAARRALPKSPLDVAGSLDLDTLVTGTLRKPQIVAGFDLENGRYGSFALTHVIGNGRTDLHAVTLDSVEVGFAKGTAVLAGSLPIVLSPPKVGPANAPLSLTLDARGIDLAQFGKLAPGGDTKLAGTVDGRIALEGTVAQPRVLGSAHLSGGSYVSKFETQLISNVNADLAFGGTSVTLSALHADVGPGGSLDARGDLNLPIPGAPSEGYRIAVVAKKAKLNFPQYGGGQIDGTAEIVSGPERPTLSGDVTLTNTSIPFAAIFRASSTADAGPAAPRPFDIAFNLRATAGKNVRINSPIINVGATGEVLLTGTTRSPRVAGVFTATRGGTFSTYQRLFRIQSAVVAFDPAQGIVPTIDLTATAHVSNPDPDSTRNAIGAADITVTVTGPADGYSIAYASDPPYSQAQIIGLLVDAPFLGAVNFGVANLPGTLPGAPGESNVLLPPGVTPYQTGTYTIQQEAVSLLNTQLTQRLIAPLENAFGGALGVTDLQLTLDLGGRIGYTARQQLSKKKQVFGTIGQVLSYPVRTQLGFEARPDSTSSLGITYYQQSGTPSLNTSQFGNAANISVLNGVQPLNNRQGFRIIFTRSYK